MASQGPNHALDSQSKEAEIVGILSACCFITTMLVILRVITRAVIIRSFGPDDWVVVVAQVLAIGAAVIIGLGESSSATTRHVRAGEDEVVLCRESCFLTRDMSPSQSSTMASAGISGP